jgi:hypothetical protein
LDGSMPSTAPDMPDLAAALAEVAEMQKPAPSEDFGLQRPKVCEPAPAAPPPEPEPEQRTPFPTHPAIPCTSCSHPRAVDALREILNVYVAATRGKLHPTGSAVPRVCCQWSCQQRPDARAMIA